MRCRARGEVRAAATRETGSQTAHAPGRPGTRAAGERPAKGGARPSGGGANGKGVGSRQGGGTGWRRGRGREQDQGRGGA